MAAAALARDSLMLRVEHLDIAIGQRVLARDVSFAANAGQVWAVLGPNGSGKTTLLQTLAGLRAPRGGNIYLSERELGSYSPRQRAREIAYMPQREEQSFWGSVHDYVMLARFAHDDENTPESEQRVAAILADSELSPVRQRRVQTLSGGEWQRACLAQIWAQDARTIYLDEPLQHLDPRFQLSMMQRCADEARQRQRLIFMVLHDSFWALRYCDFALMIFSSEVMAGPVRDVVTRENLSRLYGMDAAHFEHALP